MLCHSYLSQNMRKPTFWLVRPTNTQIRLHIHTVWSESSLSVWRHFASSAIQNALSVDSHQTAQMILIFARHTGPKVHFLTLKRINPCHAELIKMPLPLPIFSQSVYLIQVVDINSHTEWQTVQIQISWLLQKPTNLDLHCLQRQGISRFSRTRVSHQVTKGNRQWDYFQCSPYVTVAWLH